MPEAQLAARINLKVKKAIEQLCKDKGLKMNKFIENALLDKLEELEDIEDLKSIRHEPTRPFDELLKELKLDGKL